MRADPSCDHYCVFLSADFNAAHAGALHLQYTDVFTAVCPDWVILFFLLLPELMVLDIFNGPFFFISDLLNDKWQTGANYIN